MYSPYNTLFARFQISFFGTLRVMCAVYNDVVLSLLSLIRREFHPHDVINFNAKTGLILQIIGISFLVSTIFFGSISPQELDISSLKGKITMSAFCLNALTGYVSFPNSLQKTGYYFIQTLICGKSAVVESHDWHYNFQYGPQARILHNYVCQVVQSNV